MVQALGRLVTLITHDVANDKHSSALLANNLPKSSRGGRARVFSRPPALTDPLPPPSASLLSTLCALINWAGG